MYDESQWLHLRRQVLPFLDFNNKNKNSKKNIQYLGKKRKKPMVQAQATKL